MALTQEKLNTLFPASITNAFFEAMYGDAKEGAYDITLKLVAEEADRLMFAFELHQRPGKCLVCQLTYGLPHVFQRHPIINLAGLSKQLAEAVGWDPETVQCNVGRTEERSRDVHVIPWELTR